MTPATRNPAKTRGFLFFKNIGGMGLHFPKTIVDSDAVVNDKQRTRGRTMTVSVTNKDFSYAVKFLKKRGFVFNASAKTWSGTGDIEFLLSDGYVVEIKLAG